MTKQTNRMFKAQCLYRIKGRWIWLLSLLLAGEWFHTFVNQFLTLTWNRQRQKHACNYQMMLFHFFLSFLFKNFFWPQNLAERFRVDELWIFFSPFSKKSITAFSGSFSNAVLRLPIPAWHCINVSGNSTIARKHLATNNTCVST